MIICDSPMAAPAASGSWPDTLMLRRLTFRTDFGGLSPFGRCRVKWNSDSDSNKDSESDFESG